MTRLASAVIALLLLSAVPAHAQGGACDHGQTKIFGCMDIPSDYQTVSRAALTFQGWALSCYTAQQPSDLQVWYQADYDANGNRPFVQAKTSEYTVTWRLSRPDVQAYYQRYCGLAGPNWGYSVTLNGSNVPLGTNIFALLFFDPAVGVAMNVQQAYVTVVP